MEQPVPKVDPVPDADRLLDALGVAGSELPVERYDNGLRHIVVTLASAEEVAALRPDGPALEAFAVTGVNCVARSDGVWRSRMFWAHGEDAATGSAAGPIACHLARHGWVGWGEEVEIVQGVEIGRPSRLFARAEGGGGLIDRVEVGGSAVVVARGEFRL
jgi:trans-2,3-dihydro-3-hydroxyanthranilate isomerase